VRYLECGQVEKDIRTTFPLPSIEGYSRGFYLSGYRSDIFSSVRLAHLGAGATVRGGRAMNAMYVLGGILSVSLLVYLLIALLKPEKF
jgi:K+-transporting ATPase KdpF subunit